MGQRPYLQQRLLAAASAPTDSRVLAVWVLRLPRLQLRAAAELDGLMLADPDCQVSHAIEEAQPQDAARRHAVEPLPPGGGGGGGGGGGAATTLCCRSQ